MPRSLRLISSVDVVYFQTSRARQQLDSPTMPQSADPSQAKFELIKKWSLCFCPRSCKRNILVRLLERTMSLLLALDSAIQETEEFKRNEASGTKDATEKSKIPKSAKEAASFTDLTNSQPSTAAKRAQTGRDPSKGQTEHDSNDTSGIEILGVPHSQLKSNETLPPLPAQSSDPAVTSAMIKLSSMLAASDANPIRYMIMRPPQDPMNGPVCIARLISIHFDFRSNANIETQLCNAAQFPKTRTTRTTSTRNSSFPARVQAACHPSRLDIRRQPTRGFFSPPRHGLAGPALSFPTDSLKPRLHRIQS